MIALAEMTRTDGALLAEFARTKQEAAFEELVLRHEQLVFGVCRRVLGQTQDAEDAAQTVFVTLAQKAPNLTDRPTLAGWLHTTAWNVANRLRENRSIQRKHEQEAGVVKQQSESIDPIVLNELKSVMDRELNDLPEEYRVPILLHHVQGYTKGETARLMGSNPGTVSAWLDRGRDLLRQRLSRYGTALSAAFFSADLSQSLLTSVPGGFACAVAKTASLAATQSVAAAAAGTASIAGASAAGGAAVSGKAVFCVLVAVVILGGGVILVQATQKARANAKRSAVLATLNSIRMGVEMYRALWRAYPSDKAPGGRQGSEALIYYLCKEKDSGPFLQLPAECQVDTDGNGFPEILDQFQQPIQYDNVDEDGFTPCGTADPRGTTHRNASFDLFSYGIPGSGEILGNFDLAAPPAPLILKAAQPTQLSSEPKTKMGKWQTWLGSVARGETKTEDFAVVFDVIQAGKTTQLAIRNGQATKTTRDRTTVKEEKLDVGREKIREIARLLARSSFIADIDANRVPALIRSSATRFAFTIQRPDGEVLDSASASMRSTGAAVQHAEFDKILDLIVSDDF